MIGAYIGQNNSTELFIMVGLGVMATALRFAHYPLPPLIIGFILGGMMEDNLGRAVRKANGLDFLWDRPLTAGLLIVAILFLLVPIFNDWRSRKAAE